MGSFSQTVTIDASSADAWALVNDVTRLAAIFPYMQVDQVTAAEPAGWRYRRQLMLPGLATLCWHEHAWAAAEGDLHFQAEAGDLETFVGRWQVVSQGTGSALTLTLDYAVPANLANNLPEPMVKLVVNQLFAKVCARIKEALEECA